MYTISLLVGLTVVSLLFPTWVWALGPGSPLSLLWFPELKRLSPFLGFGKGLGVNMGNIWFSGGCGKRQGSGFKSGPSLMDSRAWNTQDAAASHGGCHVGSCTRWCTHVTVFSPQLSLLKRHQLHSDGRK